MVDVIDTMIDGMELWTETNTVNDEDHEVDFIILNRLSFRLMVTPEVAQRARGHANGRDPPVELKRLIRGMVAKAFDVVPWALCGLNYPGYSPAYDLAQVEAYTGQRFNPLTNEMEVTDGNQQAGVLQQVNSEVIFREKASACVNALTLPKLTELRDQLKHIEAVDLAKEYNSIVGEASPSQLAAFREPAPREEPERALKSPRLGY